MRSLVLALVLLCSSAWVLAQSAQSIWGSATGRQVFSNPLLGLTPDELESFNRGRSLFRQVWVIAPSVMDADVDGLGPLYNRPACTSCHPVNSRGLAPESEQRMRAMLVRLSIPGENAHGGPLPHPAYGDQLNEEGIPGVAGEGRSTLVWHEEAFQFPDGEQVALRRPEIKLQDMAYGSAEGILTSARVGPAVFGLGLLDAVSDQYLQDLAAQSASQGGAGRVNQVWSSKAQAPKVGRFGFKANTATLREQIAAAFIGDMGITSSLHSERPCTSVQTACQQAVSGGEPELSDQQLDDLSFYLAHLAVPERRNPEHPQVQQGEQLFNVLGCASCHRPQLHTGAQAPYPRLRNLAVPAYTDLLLHDMGEGLSDGRPDYQASAQQWRTAPLWGLGLAAQINATEQYLHDGRARSLTEAILWHGGEAQSAREAFVQLPPEHREALLAFLRSL